MRDLDELTRSAQPIWRDSCWRRGASSFWRDVQCHQKSRHHVVSGDAAGDFDQGGGVKVLLHLLEDVVAHLDLQRHLRRILNNDSFNGIQRRCRHRLARALLDVGSHSIQMRLLATCRQKIDGMVVVFVVCAGYQRDRANCQFPQAAFNRQLSAHGLEIDIPAARQRLTPEQGMVQRGELAASASFNRRDEFARLGAEGGSPGRNAHGGLSWRPAGQKGQMNR